MANTKTPTLYTFVVSSHLALVDETHADPQTDYSPGYWGLKTEKEALKIARELMARGDKIVVSDYNRPRYHAKSNTIIQELKLNQTLFPVSAPVPQSNVSNGRPSNLSQLKKYLVLGTKIHIKRLESDGSVGNERNTFVIKAQSNSWIFDNAGRRVFLEHDKATNWQFTDTGALLFSMDRDGVYVPVIQLMYLPQ